MSLRVRQVNNEEENYLLRSICYFDDLIGMNRAIVTVGLAQGFVRSPVASLRPGGSGALPKGPPYTKRNLPHVRQES